MKRIVLILVAFLQVACIDSKTDTEPKNKKHIDSAFSQEQLQKQEDLEFVAFSMPHGAIQMDMDRSKRYAYEIQEEYEGKIVAFRSGSLWDVFKDKDGTYTALFDDVFFEDTLSYINLSKEMLEKLIDMNQGIHVDKGYMHSYWVIARITKIAPIELQATSCEGSSCPGDGIAVSLHYDGAKFKITGEMIDFNIVSREYMF